MLSNEVYDQIFAPRAVTRGVAEERPYVRYPLNGRGVVYATDPKYRDELTSAEQWVVQRAVAQQPGIVISKEPFPDADPVFAQLRPDAPLVFPGRFHCHEIFAGLLGESSSYRKHLEKKDHSGVTGPQDRHRHEETAKYFLPPGPRARRYDVHPAADVKRAGGVGFLALEGSIKADAILSAGYDQVLAVPSVTCWRAPELEAIAVWASELDVFAVVSDSDWYTNEAVIGQSVRARDAFRNEGADAIHVAPPQLAKGAKTGIDDFLANGGKVEDLQVITLRLPGPIDDLVPGKRTDARRRNRRVIEEMARHATPTGYVQGTGRGLSESLGMSKEKASLAIKDLQQAGAVKEIERSTRRWEPGSGWSNTPTRWFLLNSRLRPIPAVTLLGNAFPQVRG